LNAVADDLWADIPAVCFDDDICRVTRLALRTLQKLRKARVWPIPELPRLDKRHRYSRRDVIAFLAREEAVRLVRKRSA
jgi:hypothetical protein